MNRKPVALFFATLAVLHLVAAAYLTAVHPRLEASDWLLGLLPGIIALLGIVFSLLLGFSRLVHRPVWSKALWGLFLGIHTFLLLETLILIRGFDRIATEGIAYWGFTLLAFWIGLPLLIGGGLGGAIVGRVTARRATTQKQDRKNT